MNSVNHLSIILDGNKRFANKANIPIMDAYSLGIDNVLKISEDFRESSEVSTTLLGVNRAETQLSLFSNVSSYGLNNDEWDSFSYNTV